MNRWSEKLLVRRILAGDHEACVQLIRLHHPAIYRLLVHLCRDAHLAEDLTQETFAAAWAGIGTFSSSACLATWLHRIAYRKFIDAQRRRQPVKAVEPDQIAEQVRSDAPDPLDGVLASEQSRRLYQALARLAPHPRHLKVSRAADRSGQPPASQYERLRPEHRPESLASSDWLTAEAPKRPGSHPSSQALARQFRA